MPLGEEGGTVFSKEYPILVHTNKIIAKIIIIDLIIEASLIDNIIN